MSDISLVSSEKKKNALRGLFYVWPGGFTSAWGLHSTGAEGSLSMRVCVWSSPYHPQRRKYFHHADHTGKYCFFLDLASKHQGKGAGRFLRSDMFQKNQASSPSWARQPSKFMVKLCDTDDVCRHSSLKRFSSIIDFSFPLSQVWSCASLQEGCIKGAKWPLSSTKWIIQKLFLMSIC